LFLLNPVARAPDDVHASQVRAGAVLHRLEVARLLVNAPVAPASNEARGHVDRAARPGLEFRRISPTGGAAIPLQPALETGAGVFGGVDRKFVIGKPATGDDLLGGRHL